jgi:cytochrome c peroxidase
VTKNDEHRGAFKTPTLRDVAKRPPYMHDGSHKTLEEVIALYNKGGVPNPWLSKEIRPLNLTATEQKDLVAFMEAITGQVAPEVSSPQNCRSNSIKREPTNTAPSLPSRGIWSRASER